MRRRGGEGRSSVEVRAEEERLLLYCPFRPSGSSFLELIYFLHIRAVDEATQRTQPKPNQWQAVHVRVPAQRRRGVQHDSQWERQRDDLKGEV